MSSTTSLPPPSRRERRRRLLVVVSGVAVVALLAILGGVGARLASGELDRARSIVRYTTPGGQVTVEADHVSGYGQVLATNRGYPLYIFRPDDARRVTCTGDCASAWPPLLVPPGGHLGAGAGVSGDRLGTDPGPGGGRVVTYDGWPLYTYIGDGRPGDASGQAVDDDGGYWYLIRPSGKVVEG